MTGHRARRQRWWRAPRPVIRYSTPTVTVEITGYRERQALQLLDAVLGPRCPARGSLDAPTPEDQ